MAIPGYESFMLPLLRLVERRGTVKIGEAADALADELGLTYEEREELLPSGQATTLRSRVGWAKTYLKQAGLLFQPKRAEVTLTERGKEVLASPPKEINNTFLRQFPEFLAFLARASTGAQGNLGSIGTNNKASTTEQAELTPEEKLESAVETLASSLKSELLDQIRQAEPRFFEELVVKLLLKMGYGGSRQEAGQAVGRSGDGGIDGVINEDRLGLDAVYVQAKRWSNNVGEPEIRDFKGALDAKGATKGVFITTSAFTPAAVEAARNSRAYKIVLIPGQRLAELLIEHEIGVTTVATYSVKRVDSDFFLND